MGTPPRQCAWCRKDLPDLLSTTVCPECLKGGKGKMSAEEWRLFEQKWKNHTGRR